MQQPPNERSPRSPNRTDGEEAESCALSQQAEQDDVCVEPTRQDVLLLEEYLELMARRYPVRQSSSDGGQTDL